MGIRYSSTSSSVPSELVALRRRRVVCHDGERVASKRACGPFTVDYRAVLERLFLSVFVLVALPYATGDSVHMAWSPMYTAVSFFFVFATYSYRTRIRYEYTSRSTLRWGCCLHC